MRNRVPAWSSSEGSPSQGSGHLRDGWPGSHVDIGNHFSDAVVGLAPAEAGRDDDFAACVQLPKAGETDDTIRIDDQKRRDSDPPYRNAPVFSAFRAGCPVFSESLDCERSNTTARYCLPIICLRHLCDLLRQLRPHILSFFALLYDNEEAFAVTPAFPEFSDRPLLARIVALDVACALVFRDEQSTVLQLRDEIRVELVGRSGEPERGRMARDVPQPESHLLQAVESLRALEFLAVFGTVERRNMLQEMLSWLPPPAVAPLIPIHAVPESEGRIERHFHPGFRGKQVLLVYAFAFLLADSSEFAADLAGEDEFAAHQRRDMHVPVVDQMPDQVAEPAQQFPLADIGLRVCRSSQSTRACGVQPSTLALSASCSSSAVYW